MPHKPYKPTTQPRDSVLRLADLMEYALRANEYKTSWKTSNEFALLNNARISLSKLANSLAKGQVLDYESQKHAVNVANYMMMIVDCINETD